MKFRFYYDVVCPYAYLASLRVEAMAERTRAQIEWCPILLGGLYRHHETADVPAESWAESKVAIGAADLLREASGHGAPFSPNPLHPQRTVSAMRLLTLAQGTTRIALTKALYAAYWVEGKDLNDEIVLNQLAEQHGLTMNAARSQTTKDQLRAATASAAAKGVFGVPTFEIEGELWWGQDRMHLVERALGGTDHYMPLVTNPTVKRIEFFHDFSSPYSYIGAMQMNRLAAEWGVEIDWKPMLLGALFHTIGTPNIPIFSFGEARRAYLMKDLLDWATWWGIDFNFSPHFPIRSVMACRVAIIDPNTTEPLYAAAWVDGVDLNDADALIRVLNDAGFDGEALVDGTQDPAIKAVLRANTERAAAIGACGAPTVAVGNTVFWGQDRLNRVAESL